MKRDDPKKVIVLTLVAVGACGYLAVSLFGLGSRWTGAAAPEAKAEADSRRSIDTGSALAGDPFAPALFLQKQAEAKSEAIRLANANAAASGSDGIPAGMATSPMPLPGSLNLQATAAALGPGQPADIAGIDRESKQESRTEVRLSAVVTAEKSVAFISVSGKETRPYQVGDLVAPGWRLLRISESGVVVGWGKRMEKVSVGQEVSL